MFWLNTRHTLFIKETVGFSWILLLFSLNITHNRMNKCCQQPRICSNGDGRMNEWTNTECLWHDNDRGNSVPMPCCSPQTPHRLAWCWTLVSIVTNCLSHGMAFLHQNVPSCKEYKMSRPALGPKYTPIQCILGSFSSGRVAREQNDHSPLFSAKF